MTDIVALEIRLLPQKHLVTLQIPSWDQASSLKLKFPTHSVLSLTMTIIICWNEIKLQFTLEKYSLLTLFTGPNIIFIWYTVTHHLTWVVLHLDFVSLSSGIMHLAGKIKPSERDFTVNSVTCFVIWWKVLFVQPDVCRSLIKDLYFCDNENKWLHYNSSPALSTVLIPSYYSERQMDTTEDCGEL